MPTKILEHYMRLKYRVELLEGVDGGCFVTHPELDGCMAEGGTPEEALRNLADSRELWIESRLANGYPVPEPKIDGEFSGKLSLRMTPSLHSKLAGIAEGQKVSLNLLINQVLSEYSGGVVQKESILAEVRDWLTLLAPGRLGHTPERSVARPAPRVSRGTSPRGASMPRPR